MSTRRSTVVLAAVAFGAMLAGAAQAEEISDADAAVLAGACANCHGTDGHSPGAIPSIAGMPQEAMAAMLSAFKAGDIPDTTVMTRIARGYSDAEIDALARYFSEISE